MKTASAFFAASMLGAFSISTGSLADDGATEKLGTLAAAE